MKKPVYQKPQEFLRPTLSISRKKFYERSEYKLESTVKKDILKSTEDIHPTKNFTVPQKKNNEPTISSITNIKKVNFEIIPKNNMSYYHMVKIQNKSHNLRYFSECKSKCDINLTVMKKPLIKREKARKKSLPNLEPLMNKLIDQRS